MIAQLIPNPFAPIPLYLIPWLFFAFVFTVVSLCTYISLVILRRFEALRFLRRSDVTKLITLFLGGMSVWLCWPTLHDYRDVTAVAKPGVSISVVTKRLGEPSQHNIHADGTQHYLYAEGMMYGYTSITTDSKGIIVHVGYAD